MYDISKGTKFGARTCKAPIQQRSVQTRCANAPICVSDDVLPMCDDPSHASHLTSETLRRVPCHASGTCVGRTSSRGWLSSLSSNFGKQSTSRRSIVRFSGWLTRGFNEAGLLLGRVLPGSIYEEHWRREALSPVIKILCIRVVDIANRDLLENDRRCVRESATG